MIREWGSPTLFLTFSCAEYESPFYSPCLMFAYCGYIAYHHMTSLVGHILREYVVNIISCPRSALSTGNGLHFFSN